MLSTPRLEGTLALLDAGVFIGALLRGDPRHREARDLVERARRGDFSACTTTGILSEVYGALTWEQARPQQEPAIAAEAVRLLVEPPSAIAVLEENRDVILLALDLSRQHHLTARRVHDARHAAAALVAVCMPYIPMTSKTGASLKSMACPSPARPRS